jgi:sterol desaturase/sphingolipid hydroxylase (fatty acid hydroxylase superfamily)
MFNFDSIGVALLFTAFFIEFTLILVNKPDKKVMKDMSANFILGLLIILVGLFIKGLAFSCYSFVYSFSVFNLKLSLFVWIVGFLCCDFIHYFYHWLGHSTRLFWAAHVTHHSSQHFNFSTGLRTNFFHLFYRFLFWAPLCFLGFPPEMILFIESVTAIENFLVHTEKIGKLGVLDWIFNTPSNHRVHHASNPEYIDKNLGGILMIYDHIFGTFAKEKTAPVYGITNNIDTHNPYNILVHEYQQTIKKLKTIKGFGARIRYLFSKPK